MDLKTIPSQIITSLTNIDNNRIACLINMNFFSVVDLRVTKMTVTSSILTVSWYYYAIIVTTSPSDA